jgi:hypothetical protein
MQMEVLMKSKSKWFFTGMTVLLLSFGLIMAGCNNDGGTAGGNAPGGSNNSGGGGSSGGGGNNNNNGDNNNGDNAPGGSNNNGGDGGGGGNNNNGDNNNGDNNTGGSGGGGDDQSGGGGDDQPVDDVSVYILGVPTVRQNLTAFIEGFGSDLRFQWETKTETTENSGKATSVYSSGIHYVIPDEAEGCYIRVIVTDGNNNRAVSELVGPIMPGAIVEPPPPPKTTPPGIVTIGTDWRVKNPEVLRPGDYLVADTSQLGGEGKISYQWQHNPERSELDPDYFDCWYNHDIFVDIPGATGEDYKLGDEEYGSYVRVVVGREGYPEKITSEPILSYAAVLYADFPVTIPITRSRDTLELGDAQNVQNRYLRAGKLTYQWKRGDTPNGPFTNISGATSRSYTLNSTDDNKYFQLAVGTILAYGTVLSKPYGPVTR